MAEKTFTQIVLNELHNSLLGINEDKLEAFVEMICPEKRIFCDGAGRSRLQIQGFAMRLTQMEFQSSIVGEPTVPAITADDILLVCSASGETPAMIAHAEKAKAIGARVLLITANSKSSLASVCDRSIVIQASSKQQITGTSIQPMGSLFEQSVGILLDIIVLHLMIKYQITNQDMVQNHANLE